MILHVVIDGQLHKLTLERNLEAGHEEESFVCEIHGERLSGSARLLEPGILSLLLGVDSYRCILDTKGDEPTICIDGERYGFAVEDPRSIRSRLARREAGGGPRQVKAPMPGRVLRVLAEEGADVQAQQGLFVIEAMKMQNEIKAPKAGRVAQLRTAPGATVNAGEMLAVIE